MSAHLLRSTASVDSSLALAVIDYLYLSLITLFQAKVSTNIVVAIDPCLRASSASRAIHRSEKSDGAIKMRSGFNAAHDLVMVWRSIAGVGDLEVVKSASRPRRGVVGGILLGSKELWTP